MSVPCCQSNQNIDFLFSVIYEHRHDMQNKCSRRPSFRCCGCVSVDWKFGVSVPYCQSNQSTCTSIEFLVFVIYDHRHDMQNKLSTSAIVLFLWLCVSGNVSVSMSVFFCLFLCLLVLDMAFYFLDVAVKKHSIHCRVSVVHETQWSEQCARVNARGARVNAFPFRCIFRCQQ